MALSSHLRGLTLLLIAWSAAAADAVSMLVPPDVLGDYRTWLGSRDPLHISDFSGPGTRRDVIEVALVQQALAAGGETRSVTFVEVPTYQRMLAELRAGQAVLLGTSAWRSDLEQLGQEVVISQPLIREGGFTAGLYTVPTNARALAARTLADVRQLSFVSSPAWTADWATLQHVAPVRLDGTPTWEAMVRMVAVGNVDVLLAPFQSTDDLSCTVEGVRLVPIPHIKIRLLGSRHVAVSTRHPFGPAVAVAFERGLSRMIAAGIVEQAYRESGFTNAKVATWTQLP